MAETKDIKLFRLRDVSQAVASFVEMTTTTEDAGVDSPPADQEREEGELEEGELEDQEEDGDTEVPHKEEGEEPGGEAATKEAPPTAEAPKDATEEKEKEKVDEKESKERSKRGREEFDDKRRKRKKNHHDSGDRHEGMLVEDRKKYRRHKYANYDQMLKEEMYLRRTSTPDIYRDMDPYNLSPDPPPYEPGCAPPHFPGARDSGDESFESGGSDVDRRRHRVMGGNRARLRSRSRSRSPHGLLHKEETGAICIQFQHGNCPRGDSCQYTHTHIQRKMELCKFYKDDRCAKKGKCLYMHNDFPCKLYHTGRKCQGGNKCKYSHDHLTSQTKAILVKVCCQNPRSYGVKKAEDQHIELAPKEILGEFPRITKQQAYIIVDITANYRRGNTEVEKDHLERIVDLYGKGFKYVDKILRLYGFSQEGSKRREEKMQKRAKEKRESERKNKSDAHGHQDVPNGEVSTARSPSPSLEDRISTSSEVIQNKGTLGVLHAHLSSQILRSSGSPSHTKSHRDFSNSRGYRDAEPHRSKSYRDSNNPLSSKSYRDIESPPPSKSYKSFDNQHPSEGYRNYRGQHISRNYRDSRNSPPHRSYRDTEDAGSMIKDFREAEEAPPVSPGNQEEINSETLTKSQRELHDRIRQIREQSTMEQAEMRQEARKHTGNVDGAGTHNDSWYSSDDDNVQEGPVSQQDEEGDPSFKEGHPKDSKSGSESAFPSMDPQKPFLSGFNLANINIPKDLASALSDLKNRNDPKKQSQNKTDSSKRRLDIEQLTSRVSQHVEDVTSFRGSNSRSSAADTKETAGGSAGVGGLRDPRLPRDWDGSDSEHDSQSRDPRMMNHGLAKEPTGKPAAGDTDLRVMSHVQPGLKSKDFDVDLRNNEKTIYDVDLRQLSSIQSGSEDLDMLPFKVPSHSPAKEIDASLASHPEMQYKLTKVDIPTPDFSYLRINPDDPRCMEDPRIYRILRRRNSVEESQNQVARESQVMSDSPASPPPSSSQSSQDPRIVSRDPRQMEVKGDIQNDPRIPTRTDPRISTRVDPRMAAENRDPRTQDAPFSNPMFGNNMLMDRTSVGPLPCLGSPAVSTMMGLRNSGMGLLGPRPGMAHLMPPCLMNSAPGNPFFTPEGAGFFPPNQAWMGIGASGDNTRLKRDMGNSFPSS